MGSNHASVLALSTGAPQGCVRSPLLYTPYPNDCTSIHDSNIIINIADDTAVLGLLDNNDESAKNSLPRASTTIWHSTPQKQEKRELVIKILG